MGQHDGAASSGGWWSRLKASLGAHQTPPGQVRLRRRPNPAAAPTAGAFLPGMIATTAAAPPPVPAHCPPPMPVHSPPPPPPPTC